MPTHCLATIQAWLAPASELITLDQATPILIATAALMAMVSLRNSDIATRIRNNVDEILYKMKPLDDATKAARFANLQQQNRILIARYRHLSWAFIFLNFATVLLASGVCLSQRNATFSGLLIVLSLGSFAIGFIIIMWEFWVGPATLLMNNNLNGHSPLAPTPKE